MRQYMLDNLATDEIPAWLVPHAKSEDVKK
jgi:hypothetical protein